MDVDLTAADVSDCFHRLTSRYSKNSLLIIADRQSLWNRTVPWTSSRTAEMWADEQCPAVGLVMIALFCTGGEEFASVWTAESAR